MLANAAELGENKDYPGMVDVMNEYGYEWEVWTTVSPTGF
jgi:hypothetical protein